MRILASAYHPRAFWPYSGSERRFCAVTSAWSRTGIETWALEPEPFATKKLEAGYRPIPVPIRGSNLAGELLSWYLEAVPRGLAAARETPVDVVYATNNNLFNLLVGADLARRLRIPCVVVVHHLRWVTYPPTPADEPQGRYRPLAFLEALGREGSPGLGAVSRTAGAAVESRLLRQFDAFLTVSDAVRLQVESLVPGALVFTTGNGMDSGQISAPSAADRGADAVFVGRIDEGKGTLDLVHVWEQVIRRVPEARLQIVGDGSLRPRLEDHVGARHLGASVRLRGFLDNSALDSARRTSRVFITLSRTEGFGIALAEALAAGLPVVAWDIPPFREVWGACPAVSLCPIGDVHAVAEAVLRIFATPGPDWERLSREASSYVRRYAWEDVASREANALREIAEAR